MRNSEQSRTTNIECGQAKWCVYILRCRNNTLYTGITDNIARRLKEHNTKKGGRYTSAFGPVELVWQEDHPDRSSAMKREHQIKGWTRRKKEALIKGDYSLLKQL